MEFRERRLDGKRTFRLDGAVLEVENYDLVERLQSRDTVDLSLLVPGPRELTFQHPQYAALRKGANIFLVAGALSAGFLWLAGMPPALYVSALGVGLALAAGQLWAARHFKPLVNATGWRTRAGTHGLDVVRAPDDGDAYDAFVSAVDEAVASAGDQGSGSM